MAAKGKWVAFPHPAKAFGFAGEALKKNWGELHRGDCEPWPKDAGFSEALVHLPGWKLVRTDKVAKTFVREQPL